MLSLAQKGVSPELSVLDVSVVGIGSASGSAHNSFSLASFLLELLGLFQSPQLTASPQLLGCYLNDLVLIILSAW